VAQKRAILIVDDELGARESLRMIFRPNYQVHTAVDGKEALQSIQKDKIDLVALDLRMPGLSGLDVLRQIKKNDPDIEVIVITAHGTAEDAKEAVRYGAGDFITKPFNVSDLVNSVNKSLERRSKNLRFKNFSRYNDAVVRKS